MHIIAHLQVQVFCCIAYCDTVRSEIRSGPQYFQDYTYTGYRAHYSTAQSRPLEKVGCFAAKMRFCGMQGVSLSINQSEPLPKRRDAVSQSDWAKNKKLKIKVDIDIPC